MAAAAAVLYALTLTRDFGGDDTVFAHWVDLWLRGGGARWLLHPHHLLHLPLVAATAWVARWMSGAVFVLDAGAWVSVVAAAAVVGGVVPLLRSAGVREGVALLTAAVATVSGGLWQFGTMAEAYALEAVAVLVWVWVASRERPPWVGVAVSLALACLSHLALVLLVVPSLWLLRRQRRQVAAVVAVGLVAPALVVAAIAWQLLDLRSLADLWRWVFTPSMGGYLAAPSPAATGAAVAGAVVWRWFERVPVFAPAVAGWLRACGGAALLLLLPLPLLGAASSWRASRVVRVACLGLASLLPLWMVWDAGNVEHVVGAIPLLAVLTAFGAASLPAPRGELLLGATAALLLVSNGVGSALPRTRPENCRTAVIASFVHERVSPEGLVMTLGRDPALRLGLPYLSGRRVTDLTLLAEGARRQGVSADAALERWLGRARDAGELWLLGDVLDPSSADLVEALGVDVGTWRRAVACLVPGNAVVLAADPVVVRAAFALVPARFDQGCGGVRTGSSWRDPGEVAPRPRSP